MILKYSTRGKARGKAFKNPEGKKKKTKSLRFIKDSLGGGVRTVCKNHISDPRHDGMNLQ